MSEKNWTKFPILFSLYIAQSVPMSFFSTVVPVIMRQENYSLQSIGLLQLVKLPWIFKFLWAPLIDNSAQSKKKLRLWILGSELFYALVIVSIAFFNLETNFELIVILLVIAFTASATQDIATDIFAIRILKPEERGIGNSMQSAGSFAGSLLGTGVLLLAYYYFGWTNLLLLLASFVAFAIIPMLLYRHPVEASPPEKKVQIWDVFLFFKERKCRKHLLILLFYYSGIIGILAMLKPYMVDLGYNVKEIGFMSGIVGTSVAVLFSLLSGMFIRRYGKKLAIYLFAFINLGVASYFYYLAHHPPGLFEMYLAIILLWGAYGLSTVVIYTQSMDMVRVNKEGTDFTVQIVLTHLSGLIMAIISGHVGDRLGYHGLFGIEMALAFISILIILYNFPVWKKMDCTTNYQ